MESYVLKKTKVLNNIICDICGNSCKLDQESIEFARINACWGYFSQKDGSQYKIDLCEKCFDKTINFLENIKGQKINPVCTNIL